MGSNIDSLEKLHDKLDAFLYYNGLIRFYLESFVKFTFVSLIMLESKSIASFIDTLVFSVIILVFIVLVPLFFAYFLMKH